MLLLIEHPCGISGRSLTETDHKKRRRHEIQWEYIKLDADPQHERHTEDAAAPARSTAQEQVSPAESDEAAESAASSDESWKTDFEKSLWENYTVTPEYYADLGDGVYQVYVKIDGKTVPYVCVDSATGDYHG